MLKFSFICFILFLTVANAFSQTTKTVILLDQQSNDPVPYANIGTGSYSIYSDHLGKFSLDSLKADTISINRLGYKSLKKSMGNIRDTVFFVPDSFSLKAIEIYPSDVRYEAGYHDQKSDGLAKGGFRNGKGVRISSIPRNAQITKVFIHTKKNRRGFLYRTSLFTIDSLGFPDNLLYTREYSSPTGKNSITIPIEEKVVTESGNIAIVVVWIDESVEKSEKFDEPFLRLTRQVDDMRSFDYFKITNRWHYTDYKSTIGYHWNYKIGLEYTVN